MHGLLCPAVVDADGTWYWSTNTAGKGVPPRRFVMQGDGNAIIADSRQPTNKALWATYTAGQ
jgi:hypothetical protein